MTDKLQNNRFNTWDNVREEREKIEEKNSPVRDDLESSWQLLQVEYGGTAGGDEVGWSEGAAESPLYSFLYNVEMGFYPPPEVMLSVISCFKHYLLKQGKIELEDAFFNTKKRGVGNHSAVSAADSLKKYVWASERRQCLPAMRRRYGAPRSITKLADEAYLSFGIDENEFPMENFLRSYRRWKKRHGLKEESEADS